MSNFTYRTRRGRRPSSTDWLQILDIDGPFLAAPVVTDTWPDGLPALDQARMDALRTSNSLYDANPGARDGFIRHVLVNTLDWRHNLAWGPDAAAFAVTVPEHQTSVDITFAMQAQDDTGVVTPGAALLLGMVLPPKTATTGRAPVGGGTWTAGPADRLAHALRVRGVPLGLVTNGDTWTLVSVSDGGVVNTATWTRHAWLEEPQTLRAFVTLLTRARFLGVAADQTLPALLTASLARQEEVTERLAEQSQAVVEMLVATLGRLEAAHRVEHGAGMLPDTVGPAEVYQASVTVLMRLVFLLYAEERGLLPFDDDTYGRAYAVTTLAESLRERATDHGEDALERTATGWYRLLSLFRGVHRGARHEQLILPAYGGSLFDPDRFPWLEGRADASEPLGSGRVPAIDDRTLLRALDALQTLQFAKERRRISYRSLDVEQIGYVYEGLLDQDARTAEDWVLSIAVSDKNLRKNGPEVFLTDLEAQHSRGKEALATWLVEQMKAAGGNRSKASILKALTPPTGDDAQRYARLVREACGNDDIASSRVMPYCRLLRMDPRDLPVVYPPGSLYLTDSSARANTGAVYTPRFLAEQVVETTLEALVYNPGPLETEDKTAWVLRTPEQILELKVCDIAAGSGAFLVAATRYLADRLLEAHRQHVPASEPESDDETPPPVSLGARELEEQELLDARRAVIDHCIYGVDINPMAVEMAKLSLWLVTLDPRRPFSFLDDRLAVGDSLLGITSPDQLRDLHFDPKRGREIHKDTFDLFAADTASLLKSSSELRKEIAEIDLRDTRDAEHKRRLLQRSHELTRWLGLIADGLVGASLAGGADVQYLTLASLVRAASEREAGKVEDFEKRVHAGLKSSVSGIPHRPAHYPLLFPEVFIDGRDGFDAIVGNPPWLGGGQISGAFGKDYREHLATVTARGKRAKRPDLVAFFYLTADDLTSPAGVMSLLATKTLGQGDTRELGLDQILTRRRIFQAWRSRPWPTSSASVEYVCTWLADSSSTVHARLDGERVTGISSTLDTAGGVQGVPFRLQTLRGRAFQGSVTYGSGFILSPEEGRLMLAADARNSHVVKPYLSGDDVNASPSRAPSRYIIDFGTMGAGEARRYEAPWRHVERHVREERKELSGRPEYARIVENWWQYWAPRRELYEALGRFGEGICLARTSSTLAPVPAPRGVVFSDGLIVVCGSAHTDLATVSSSVHFAWILRFKSTMGKGLRYSITDLFETFVLPDKLSGMSQLGRELDELRSAACRARGIGLTELSPLVHSEDSARDLHSIRSVLEEIDRELFNAYGWSDLDPSLTLQDTDLGRRLTLPIAMRSEVVDRLLKLNHERHAAEVAVGLHDTRKRRPLRAKAQPAGDGPTLFGGQA